MTNPYLSPENLAPAAKALADKIDEAVLDALRAPLYPVGYICLTDAFCWPVYGRKPPAFHLAMLKAFFGITWRDAR